MISIEKWMCKWWNRPPFRTRKLAWFHWISVRLVLVMVPIHSLCYSSELLGCLTSARIRSHGLAAPINLCAAIEPIHVVVQAKSAQLSKCCISGYSIQFSCSAVSQFHCPCDGFQPCYKPRVSVGGQGSQHPFRRECMLVSENNSGWTRVVLQSSSGLNGSPCCWSSCEEEWCGSQVIWFTVRKMMKSMSSRQCIQHDILM